MRKLKELVLDGTVEIEGEIDAQIEEAWVALVDGIREEVLFEVVDEGQEIDLEVIVSDFLPEHDVTASVTSVIGTTAIIDVDVDGPDVCLHATLTIGEDE